MRRLRAGDNESSALRGNRKKEVLAETLKLVSHFGFWGFTIRDVAEATHLTDAGVLYYFKSKSSLIIEVLKYADEVNRLDIARTMGVSGVTGKLEDGIAYHCDAGLRELSIATVKTNAIRPELVRLYAVLEGESLSKSHPAHEYFIQREKAVLKEYATAAERDDVAVPERTARQVLSTMDGLQMRWLNDQDLDLVREWEQFIDILIPIKNARK